MPSRYPIRGDSKVKAHIAFSEFQEDLQRTVDQVCPSGVSPYERIAVLSLTWSNDDVNVTALEDDLLSTLENDYGCFIEKFVIETKDASLARKTNRQVNRAVFDRVMAFGHRHDSLISNRLLIYYYSGYGDTGPNNDTMRWAGAVDRQGRLALPILNWFDIANYATGAPKSDTAVILDCCSAGMVSIQGETEVLGTCRWGQTTTSSSSGSFTQVLIDQLKLYNGGPVSLVQLYAEMVHHALASNINPVHIPHIDGRPSIMLHKPIPTSSRLLQARTTISPVGVLVKVDITGSDSVPDPEIWAKWLTTNMPPDLQRIEIQLVLPSSSSIMIVSLPATVWSYLSYKPGYTYIDTVRDATSSKFLAALARAKSRHDNVQVQSSAKVQLPLRNVEERPGQDENRRI